MRYILSKLIRKEEITDKDIEEELLEMCEQEHSGCNDMCLIYRHLCPIESRNRTWNCPYFKLPKKMLIKLREVLK